MFGWSLIPTAELEALRAAVTQSHADAEAAKRVADAFAARVIGTPVFTEPAKVPVPAAASQPKKPVGSGPVRAHEAATRASAQSWLQANPERALEMQQRRERLEELMKEKVG